MSDVKSARRVLEILRFFSQEREPASLARVSAALELPKSSCMALLDTLVAEGYAYQTDGRYYLTARWSREADAVTRNDRLAPRCRSTLQHLSDEVGETVILAQLSQRKVVYLDVIEAAHVLRFSAFVGQRKPLHAAASGRALMSMLDDDALRKLAESLNYEGYTTATLASPKALIKAVEQGRARGWHLNLGEHQAGTVSIAAPTTVDATPLALVVGAPAGRVEGRLDRIGATLKRAAASLMAAQQS